MSSKIEAPIFRANLIIKGKIECLTGLHIGGSKEKLEIGGVDSIVVRSPASDLPYIPGSSIKGKLRHLLEYILGGVGEPVFQNKDEKLKDILGRVSRKKEIVRIFGAGASERDLDLNDLKDIGLTRLIVRDAYPDGATVKLWNSLGSDSNLTEYKAENTIDRLTSAANPRFIERVVEGSKFDFEMVYSVFEMPNKDYIKGTNEDLENIFMGLRLLETSALGKSGSRGYGKIRFNIAPPIWLKEEDYRSGDSEAWTSAKAELKDGQCHYLEAYDFDQHLKYTD